MAVFGYGRSTIKAHATERQRHEIERQGYTPDRWFADEGISGKTPTTQRPQFMAMLDAITQNETLVVCRLDCLGRDAEDVLKTIRMLAERGVKVIVLPLGGLDLTSSDGKMMLTMLDAVASMEKDLLVERTRSGLAKAKAEGRTLGRPSKTTPEQRTQIITEYSQGHTVSELAKRYGISRASVLAIITPKTKKDDVPFGWGD